MYLRQSTAQTVRFGPFLDSTDGVTPETGLTIAQADMQLSKDGGAFAQKNTTGDATPDTDGWYSTSLDTSDTGTVGELLLQVTVSGSIPVWVRWYVVEEAVYDTYFAASADGVPAAYNNFDPTSDAVATVTDLTNLPTAPAGWITAISVASGALDSKGDWNIGKTGYSLTQTFPSNFADLAITSSTGRVTVGTNNDKTGYSISGTKTTLDALNDLASAAVTSAAETALSNYGGATAGDITTAFTEIKGAGWDTTNTLEAIHDDLAVVDGIVDNILVDTGTDIPAQITGLNNISTAEVNAEVVDALNVDTYAEPGQGTPGATISLAAKIGYLYKFLRNKREQTSTTLSIYDNSESTVDHKATVADSGTVASRGEFGSGP